MMWIRAAGGTWHVLRRWEWTTRPYYAAISAGVTRCGRKLNVIDATYDESEMKGERCKTCQKRDH